MSEAESRPTITTPSHIYWHHIQHKLAENGTGTGSLHPQGKQRASVLSISRCWPTLCSTLLSNLAYNLAYSLAYTLGYTLAHTPRLRLTLWPNPLAHIVAHVLAHTMAYPLAHMLAYNLPHSLAYTLAHVLAYAMAYALAHTLAHVPAHALAHILAYTLPMGCAAGPGPRPASWKHLGVTSRWLRGQHCLSCLPIFSAICAIHSPNQYNIFRFGYHHQHLETSCCLMSQLPYVAT